MQYQNENQMEEIEYNNDAPLINNFPLIVKKKRNPEEILNGIKNAIMEADKQYKIKNKDAILFSKVYRTDTD